MHQIVFLAQDSAMFENVKKLLQDNYPDIHLIQAPLTNDINYIKKLISQGVEILITRGGMNFAIKIANLNITVIEIPLTASDTMQAIKKAQQYGDKIGIISYPTFTHDIKTMTELFDSSLDLQIYSCKSEEDAEIKTQQAFKDGCKAIVCGCMGQKFAKKYKVPFEFVPNGTAAILSAVEEARRIAHACNLEKAQTTLFRTVLDYAYEGIISIDNTYKVLSFNPQAEQILGISADTIIHNKITLLLPKTILEMVLNKKTERIGEILSVNGIEILCNIVPLQVNEKITGAIITLQDITQIQKMESHVRQRLYENKSTNYFSFKDIEINNPDLSKIIQVAKQFALTNSSVLITGETGTGKEIFAQSIHSYSSCHKGPFVAINCAALPVQILESELFGYTGGSFTGANAKGKPGLFELAHNGTIFLDEIGEMEFTTQGKLLRVLQEKTVRRLGSNHIIPINVRIIAATNRDLKKMISENKFRSDLYYRLNVLQLHLPPLRKRPNDIPVLANLFLQEHTGIIKRSLKLTQSALNVLKKYSWPGNVRELQNVIERVVAIHKHESITADIIQFMLKDSLYEENNVYELLQESEIDRIQNALIQCHGNKSQTAEHLGISRSTLWRKLKQLSL